MLKGSDADIIVCVYRSVYIIVAERIKQNNLAPESGDLYDVITECGVA